MRSAPSEAKITTIPSFNPSGSEVVANIKRMTEELIKYVEENVPHNRRRSVGLTELEGAAMWLVKANFE